MDESEFEWNARAGDIFRRAVNFDSVDPIHFEGDLHHRGGGFQGIEEAAVAIHILSK